MAKFKKAGKKTGPSSAQAQADQLSKKLSESAQQVWLAGVGAFGRAQAEGTKLFEALVKEGMNFEQGARRFAGGRADVVRDAVEARVGQARERATDTWDRLEKVFEDRVQRALVKLGVPGREDLADLAQRVDTLTAELRRQRTSAAPRSAPARKAPAKKAAAKKTVPRKRKAAPTA
jgi:poly(hydroxyalkanoate) granule-associated protein